MTEATYVRRLELDVPAEDVYRWHTRPGAFSRLLAPWEGVRLEGPPARIVPGSRQELSVPVGPFRRRWVSEITSVTEGEGFRDAQVVGPFKRWEHAHSMQPRGEDRSVLEDRVVYALPFGPLGALACGGLVRRRLERNFAYRHRITEGDLGRHRAAALEPLDVLVTGASGLVGSALCSFLTTGGHRVRRLVRHTPRSADEFRWDPVEGEIDPGATEGADVVVHLAGENIAARRWSAVQRQRLRRSRVEGTRLVANAVRAAKRRPRVMVAASAVGYYGDRDGIELDESSPPGQGFLSSLCRAWEAETRWLTGVRAVQLRFGAILSPAGGALAKMLPPFKAGVGGRLGSGRQWMSWIALDDAVGAIHHAIVTDGLAGPVNAVSPNPVTNADYTRALGGVLGRPAFLPVPAIALRVAFGQLAGELLLASQRVLPRRLEKWGYRFAYPGLEDTLRHQLGRTPEGEEEDED